MSPAQARYTHQLDGLYFSYDLEKLFFDLLSPFSVPGDCQNVSNFLVTVWNALGVSGGPMRFDAISPPDIPTRLAQFRSHPTASIGTNPLNDGDYMSHDFTFHQIGLDSAGLLAYDATLAHRFDLSAQSYRRPAKGWDHAGYFQTPVGQVMIYPPFGTLSNFVGLARNYSAHATPYGEVVEPLPRATAIVSYFPPED